MPLRFTLRQLEYLVAVADCGSVALAAERVNVSSPSISAAISQLEASYGLQLFIRRHAQGLSLTEGGRQFTATAREVLAAAGRLTDRAADITGKVAGSLTVGCLLTFAQVLLPQLRRSFSDRYPEVTFRQLEGDQAELFEGLRMARLDVALSYDLNIPPDLDFMPLLPIAPYVLLPLGHPLAGQAAVSPADLAPHPMVLLDLPHSADYFLSLFSDAGVRPMIAERTRDMGVMRAMVANGFGYSIANIWLGSDRAADGRRVVFVPLAGPVRVMQIGLLLPKNAAPRRTMTAFIDHCRANITDAALPGRYVAGTGT
ncbi:MAG: LysR family transcriptional regulator [Paracoccaceae bacterium]